MSAVEGLSEEEMLESVADALLTLANVGFGDYTTRLNVDPGDTSPQIGRASCRERVL